jgi:hypothetical protein
MSLPNSKLIPAPNPQREWQGHREGSDSYIYGGESPLALDSPSIFSTPNTQLWNARFQQWDDAFQRDYWSQVQYYWQLYRNQDYGIMLGPNEAWRDDTIVPSVFKIIETIVPRLVLSEWGGPRNFDIEAVESGDEFFEEKCKTLLRTQLNKIGMRSRRGKFIARMIEQTRYTWIVGHSWTKVGWREESIVRKIRLPKPEGGFSGWQEVLDMVYRGLDIDWLPVTAVACDLSGQSRWYIERVQTTYGELEAANEAYKLTHDGTELYKNLELIKTMPRPEPKQEEDTRREFRGTENTPTSWPDDPNVMDVEMWLCWDNLKGTLTKIANRHIELDHGLAPTWDGLAPYHAMKGLSVPGQVLGDSIIKYIGPLMVAQTRLARARADEILLNLFQQFIVRRDSVLSNELFFAPGGMIEIDAEPGQPLRDFFERLDRKPVFGEAYTEEAYKQQQQESAAGADAISQGVEATQKSRDVTASEIRQRVMQGGARWQLAMLERDVMWKSPMLTSAWETLRQNITEPEVIRVIGEDGDTQKFSMGWEDLQQPIDIVVGSGLYELSVAEKKQSLAELIQLAASPIFGPALNAQAVLEQWFVANGFKNPKRLIKSQETALNDQMGQQLGMGMAQAIPNMVEQQALGPGAEGGSPASPGNAPQPEAPATSPGDMVQEL